jgi:hypothetical protein
MSEKNATSPQRRYFINFGSKVIAVLVGGALVPTSQFRRLVLIMGGQS